MEMTSSASAIATTSSYLNLDFLASLDPNMINIASAVITGLFTMMAAYFGVTAAFKQIRRQFEHKVIHTAWKELQTNLFTFGSALSDYSVLVISLKYFLKGQNNPLVNGGNLQNYRNKKYLELLASHIALQKAYLDFLVSFENHEVILLEMRRMKTLFVEEMQKNFGDKFMDFSEAIFPEAYGETQRHNENELINIIDQQNNQLSDISGYVWDIRIELQNETIGKIIRKGLPRREPDRGMRILTKNGWKIQKRQPKRL